MKLCLYCHTAVVLESHLLDQARHELTCTHAEPDMSRTLSHKAHTVLQLFKLFKLTHMCNTPHIMEDSKLDWGP